MQLILDQFFYLKNNDLFIFASERFILKRLLKRHKFIKNNFSDISQLSVNHGLIFNLKEFQYERKNLNNIKYAENKSNKYDLKKIKVLDSSKSSSNIKRCTKCVLPETYPFMDFDKMEFVDIAEDIRNLQLKAKMNCLKRLINIVVKMAVLIV